MTAAGIALFAGGVATLICFRSVLFGTDGGPGRPTDRQIEGPRLRAALPQSRAALALEPARREEPSGFDESSSFDASSLDESSEFEEPAGFEDSVRSEVPAGRGELAGPSRDELAGREREDPAGHDRAQLVSRAEAESASWEAPAPREAAEEPVSRRRRGSRRRSGQSGGLVVTVGDAHQDDDDRHGGLASIGFGREEQWARSDREDRRNQAGEDRRTRDRDDRRECADHEEVAGGLDFEDRLGSGREDRLGSGPGRFELAREMPRHRVSESEEPFDDLLDDQVPALEMCIDDAHVDDAHVDEKHVDDVHVDEPPVEMMPDAGAFREPDPAPVATPRADDVERQHEPELHGRGSPHPAEGGRGAGTSHADHSLPGNRHQGHRVDGWVRPEYRDLPADPPAGEYWTPVPADLATGHEPSAQGYGWPTRVERLPPVRSSYQPVDDRPVETEPTELVPIWPPDPTDRADPIRLPSSWVARDENRPSWPLARQEEEPSPKRRPRPRPRPQPPSDEDERYVSRHAADPPL